MMVARRVESLRHPTSKSFDDITPDGRCYRIYRRKAAARRHGDGDDRRHAGEAGRAGTGEQGSRVSPGARQHARRARPHRRGPEHRLLQRPLQGDVSGPRRTASARPALSAVPALPCDPRLLRQRSTSRRWSRGAWKACAIRPARASKTSRRTVDAIESTVAGRPRAVR